MCPAVNVAYHGIVHAYANVVVSNLGKPTVKAEAALGEALKLTTAYREAGGVGNLSRSRSVGFVAKLDERQTLHADASINDRPGSLNPKKTTFVSFMAGYHLAMDTLIP